MTIIVTDTGFHTEPTPPDFLDLSTDVDIDDVTIVPGKPIRISVSSFADGRGFTLATLLRMRGHTGLLRAAGHVIADQYAMARRAGFDEVEISDDLAARQPEGDWLARARVWRDHDYQARLRG
jgi:uncharacterized protein (DUF934 family)